VPEDLITASRLAEPEGVVGSAQRVPQVSHPGRGDRQRPTSLRRRAQPEIELPLTSGQPLPGHSLQQLQVDIAVRRTDVLDLP
jgi:hypothetical protein